MCKSKSSFRDYTRSMHAYDASHRSKRHVQVGRAAKVSGVSRLVGVQRALRNNGNMKSEPKYLAVKNLQYVLSTVELFLVLFLLSWLLRWTDLLVLFFVRVASHRLHSTLDRFCTPLRCPLRPLSPKNVILMSLCNARGIGYILPGRDRRPQIDIPKRDRHIRLYVCRHIHCKNGSLIQSLTLMRSATTIIACDNAVLETFMVWQAKLVLGFK